MSRFWLIPLCLVAAGPGLAQVEPESADIVRSEFRAAYTLARSGSTEAAAEDSRALHSYVLYPYLEAARLGSALAAAGPAWSEQDDAVETFLTQRDGEPVTSNLRLAWLESLSTRGLPAAFLEQYRQQDADTALRCRYLSARIALDDVNGIAPLILDEWLTPYQLPLVCEPVFQWLRDTGLLDDAATEARARLLLENGQADFARIIARRLPEARAVPLFAWADLLENPLAAIEAHVASPSGDIEAPMLEDGWSRLARDNPGAALVLYDALISAEGVDDEARSRYTLALALGLAWDRRPETLDFFARVAAGRLEDYDHAWQARAALWAGELDVARRAIAAMSEAVRDSSQWRYWAARVSEDSDERERLYESLRPTDNYFSAAAAAALRDRPRTHPEPHERDEPAIARIATMPAIRRAGELRLVGLPVAAAREWRHAYAGLDGDERDQSVHVASDLGWFDLAVATATERGIFFDYVLLYPRPFADEIEAAADEFDLEPSLIYAVLRQESLYRTDAESSAGALGLMQLGAGTARDMARELGERATVDLDALDPATNIRLGAARLASMLDRFDGHLVVALAAYNAGPAAADRWLPDAPVDGDIWLENVPYNETREYVRRVLWHTVVFESFENDRVNARNWLREVEPRDRQ
ncbi:MAG TPA: transglycosylase SLT domain-containing protein [Gammaproteobacteria bacterium]|nr:transglycosylase SLT domain-containing protein [Gammaproteobacteria bacterium]